MQKVIFFVGIGCLLVCSIKGSAQEELYPHKKQPTIGVHFSLYDFKSALLSNKIGFWQTVRNGSFTNIGDMQPGLSLSFMDGLTDHLDYVIRYTACFTQYPQTNPLRYPPLDDDNEHLLSAMDASIHYKFLSDKYWVSPFLSGGVGAFNYKGDWGTYMPLGLGFQVNFYDAAYLLFNAQYQVGVSENAAPAFVYSLGLACSLGTPKKK
jgi:OOP family OmpA-OmpF porin